VLEAREAPESAEGVERKGRLARRVKRFASVVGRVNLCEIRPIKVPLSSLRTGIDPISAIRQSQANPPTLLRPGRWRCILLVQSTSIGLWGCTGRRLPLGYHTRRCERFSESISDGTSAKKFRKGPECPGTSCNLDFRHP
jgi:hypothetical protein